jgi:hypothetical protein
MNFEASFLGNSFSGCGAGVSSHDDAAFEDASSKCGTGLVQLRGGYFLKSKFEQLQVSVFR